jgi:hypothetical protein
MTVLVGVKCSDGIVIGSDSIATSSAGPSPVMQVQSNDKIQIFDGNIIVATTGAVGNAQRLNHHIQEAIRGNVFKNLTKHEISVNITRRLLQDFTNSLMPAHPHHGLGFGALLAAPIKGEPCLVEYATNNFQPEFKDGKLFYVSMGSGQPLADPFLAFISRVLWKDALPDVRLGRFGVFWALQHTIKLAPGTVGDPIKIAVLQKEGENWIASLADDNEEAEQFISGLEEKIGKDFINPLAEAEVIRPPDPPRD